MPRTHLKTSTSRLGRGRRARGAGRGHRGGGPGGRHGPVGRRIVVLRQHPRVWVAGRAYPRQTYRWPLFVLAQGCPSPLSADCTQLQITPRWAVACFKPAYHQLRSYYGNDARTIVEQIVRAAAIHCIDGQPTRGAEYELHRRVGVAVAILMNIEGVPVRYPSTARFPRPLQADAISQP